MTAKSAVDPQRSAALRRTDEQGVVRPLPVKPVQKALEPEPVVMKPSTAPDEVLPTPHVTQLEAADAGLAQVQAVAVSPLAAAEPGSIVPQGSAQPGIAPPPTAAQQAPGVSVNGAETNAADAALKLTKPRKKKLSDDPFAPKDERALDRHVPRSNDVSVDQFLITPPARRTNP